MTANINYDFSTVTEGGTSVDDQMHHMAHRLDIGMAFEDLMQSMLTLVEENYRGLFDEEPDLIPPTTWYLWNTNVVVTAEAPLSGSEEEFVTSIGSLLLLVKAFAHDVPTVTLWDFPLQNATEEIQSFAPNNARAVSYLVVANSSGYTIFLVFRGVDDDGDPFWVIRNDSGEVVHDAYRIPHILNAFYYGYKFHIPGVVGNRNALMSFAKSRGIEYTYISPDFAETSDEITFFGPDA